MTLKVACFRSALIRGIGVAAGFGALDDGIRDWIERDPDAAREWVQTSTTLRGDDRARLLRRTGR